LMYELMTAVAPTVSPDRVYQRHSKGMDRV
jgi:hypothetical protein